MVIKFFMNKYFGVLSVHKGYKYLGTLKRSRKNVPFSIWFSKTETLLGRMCGIDLSLRGHICSDRRVGVQTFGSILFCKDGVYLTGL